MPMRLLLSSPQGLKPDGVIVLPDMQIVTSKCATAFKEQTIGESAHAPGPRSPVAPAAEQTKDVGAMGVNEARSDRGRDVSPKSSRTPFLRLVSSSQTLHVCHIYAYIGCRHIWHTWSVWGWSSQRSRHLAQPLAGRTNRKWIERVLNDHLMVVYWICEVPSAMPGICRCWRRAWACLKRSSVRCELSGMKDQRHRDSQIQPDPTSTVDE